MRWIKRRILNFACSVLYKTVSLKDLENKYYELSENKQQSLCNQALQWTKGDLHEWLSTEMQRTIMKNMFEQAKNEDDLTFAKAALWVEETRYEKVNKLASLAK